ncbi:Deoxyadenosine/deoxycytidine kinase [Gracilibacillus orientalis]|uniref:Deoxyadenosine/deoxycytidine kinase n=1 Tax=Gracilibacillus orientalis TaxID=334253 RepID=A0A1I4Q5I0_9BACI|nr:deoxynucleoside kinase [Gracilibacillus orientalis]SFM34883.1 Deoxyadenosine/deoxycytidine kinase [Gracilibacillus orientalis]
MESFYIDCLKRLKKTKGDGWKMITIDGVVGVGKTTLMDMVVKELGYTPFEEPVVNNPILDKFYYDRERYSFSLQVFFLNERFKHIKNASKLNLAVLDRSIYGDVIFAKMLKDSGEMSEEEFNIYLTLFKNMIEHCQPPALMIYLEISTEEAICRINKRGRSYEVATENAYWERLNKEYREYFEAYNASPVLKINVDQLDFENNPSDREYVIALIKKKLHELNFTEAKHTNEETL